MADKIDISRMKSKTPVDSIRQIDLSKSAMDEEQIKALKRAATVDAALSSLSGPSTISGIHLKKGLQETGDILGNVDEGGTSYYSREASWTNPFQYVNNLLYGAADAILDPEVSDKVMFGASDFIDPDTGALILDVATDFIPYIGAAKGVAQGLGQMIDGFRGVDPWTGEKSDGVNWGDVGSGLLLGGLSVLPGARALTKGKKVVKATKGIAKKIADEVASTGAESRAAKQAISNAIDNVVPPQAGATFDPNPFIDAFDTALKDANAPSGLRSGLTTEQRAALEALTNAEDLRAGMKAHEGVSDVLSDLEKMRAIDNLANVPEKRGFIQGLFDTGGNIASNKGVGGAIANAFSNVKDNALDFFLPTRNLDDAQIGKYEIEKMLGASRKDARRAALSNATTGGSARLPEDIARAAKSPEELVDSIIEAFSEGKGAYGDILDLHELGPEALRRFIPADEAPELFKDIEKITEGKIPAGRTLSDNWNDVAQQRSKMKALKKAGKPYTRVPVTRYGSAVRSGITNAVGSPFALLKNYWPDMVAGTVGAGLANVSNGNDFFDNFGATAPWALGLGALGGLARGRTMTGRRTRGTAGITDRGYSLPRVLATIINQNGNLYSIDPSDYYTGDDIADILWAASNYQNQENPEESE